MEWLSELFGTTGLDAAVYESILKRKRGIRRD